MSAPQLYGLVLTGGRSRRMQRDKAGLEYGGRSQLARAMELLTPLVTRCFVSVRADQLHDPQRAAYDTIADVKPNLGPISGIHAALHAYPDHAWLILACDLPFLDRATLQYLIAHRASTRIATAYRSSFDAQPEPLCAIFEPRSLQVIEQSLAQGQQCPRALLSRTEVELLDLPNPRALDNINTGEEYAAALATLGAASTASAGALRRLRVRYFAVLREQAGRSTEELETQATTPRELYEELRRRRGLTLAPEFLRVAVNDEFGDWRSPLADGDTVVFLPPVAGG
ncbi:MAG TPA: NTP transferase domain-containing protein [Steroidobacteraceae bacterium]|jgi:molybdopterin-guanine dinucleotide biosynthesis protein A|nr:NTP transferase domain-containing protein [Steroidobacteraceae bacterium]